MKHLLKFLVVLALLAPLAGCRSKKPAVGQIEQEVAVWKSVSVPVKVQLLEPQRFTFSGTATMVRGRYVLISLRFLGFEVGQAYVTPENADIVLRQPSKIWISEPVGDRLASTGLDFTTLQETLLGNREVLSRVPGSVNVEVSGTETRPEVFISGSLKSKPVSLRLTWDLDQARWDLANPPAFSAPGAGYQKTSAAQLLKVLGK